MKYILFVCTHNAGRSQIAQAFFERHAPNDFRAESAGDDPASAIWPNVVEAMREVGIDIADRRPKMLDREMQLHADWAITLHCKGACPYVAGAVEDWDVDDPAGRPLDEVRRIRDELEQRVRDFVDTRLDDVRADKTAHQIRLARLLPAFAREFEPAKSPEEIRACADAILVKYDEAPVRSFIDSLAFREARECLREETCVVLTV
jgi:arsenate reductase (thioredoxin)